MLKPHTPKLGTGKGFGRAHWYPYYAGYSPQFVADMLAWLDFGGSDKVVLDPWNGSGTTTTVCSLNGVHSQGYDVNPVMVLVAKARLLDRNVADSLPGILDALLINGHANVTNVSRDPLDSWFNKGTARRIRAVQCAVVELLVSARSLEKIESVSSIAAFFHVLLFRLIRKVTQNQAGTNPTWVRKDSPQSVSLTFAEISKLLREDLSGIQLLDKNDRRLRYAEAAVSAADSCRLPLATGSVDAVISSPPYCTRIDYAVATRMELALIGMEEGAGEILRRSMIGTTLSQVSNGDSSRESPQPEYVADLLMKIKTHPSKASATYYHNTFRDYFEKLQKSYDEISRVLKTGGYATLVVQDSAYKDIHVDLAEATSRLFVNGRLRLVERWDYECQRSMRDRGVLRRRERKPIESVLVFEKG